MFGATAIAAKPEANVSSSLAVDMKRMRRIGWFIFAIYFIGSPSILFLPAESLGRGALLVAMPVVGMLVANYGVRHEQRSPSLWPIGIAFTAMVSWQIISTIQSLGLQYVSHLLPALAFIAFAMSGRVSLRDYSSEELSALISKLLWPLASILLVSWLVQWLGIVDGHERSAFWLSMHGFRLQGLAVHPVSLGILATLVLILTLGASQTRWIWLIRGIAILTILATNSRTALLAAFAGLLVFVLLAPGLRLGRRLLYLFGLLTTIVLSSGIVLIQRETAPDVLSGRSIIWRNVAALLDDTGWLGYGPAAVSRLFPEVGGYGSNTSQAQNQWLNDTLNFGWIGASLTTLLIVAFAIHGPWRVRRRLALPLVAAVVVTAFVEVPINLWSSTAQAVPLVLMVLMSSRTQRSSSVANNVRKAVRSTSTHHRG
jgi:hypothetical protein